MVKNRAMHDKDCWQGYYLPSNTRNQPVGEQICEVESEITKEKMFVPVCLLRLSVPIRCGVPINCCKIKETHENT